MPLPDDATPGDDLTLDGQVFVVLVNAEEQHSLWPAGKAVPDGWLCVAPPASREACLRVVEARWLDMRPASLRRLNS